MQEKIKAAIIGPGNIGIDLMYKIIKRAKNLQLDTVTGIIANSKGLRLAEELGFNASSEGIKAVLDKDEIKIVFDCTSAKAHTMHAPQLKEYGKIAVDLTPAAIGPYLIPAVNLHESEIAENVNMVTCGGQATVPIVAAINKVADVEYVEIVATISSVSAGPGTRQNIDEFTQTTANALVKVGGADKAKTIIILNPADPPIMMRNTIYCQVKNPDQQLITASVQDMVATIKEYVSGYNLKLAPIVDGYKVTAMIEVQGEGDYLPVYSGNLDIITAAALIVGDSIAGTLLAKSISSMDRR